jgi:hypothetical protein
LRNAGDLVVLTVKHYKAATPFLQKQEDKESQQTDSNSDEKEASDESLRLTTNSTNSRPSSIYSESEHEPQTRWVDIVTLPLMMAYVTRYIFGTDKLRPNAFEVRGLNGVSTGIIHCDDSAILSQWLKYITDNIIGLTNLQMKLYNRNFSVSDRIEYMGWVNEGVLNNNQPWQNYKPRFFALKGTDLMLFDSPPVSCPTQNSKLIEQIVAVERDGLEQVSSNVQSVPNDVPRRQRLGKRRRAPTLLPGPNVGSRLSVLLRRDATRTVENRKRVALFGLHGGYETRGTVLECVEYRV